MLVSSNGRIEMNKRIFFPLDGTRSGLLSICFIVVVLFSLAMPGRFFTDNTFLSIAFQLPGNDSNLLIVFYVQIMPDDFVMQLHRF